MGMVNRVTSPRMALQLSAENVIVHLRCSASALTDIRLTEQPGAYKTLCSVIPSGKCGLRRCTLPMPATCVRFPFPNWTAPNVGGDSWALPPQKKCKWPVTDSCAPLSRCHADSSSFK